MRSKETGRYLNQEQFEARFGEILPLWHNVKTLWLFSKCSFSIWQKIELVLANMLCYWANFDGINCQIFIK